jgi:hypothetical protein
VKDKFRIESNAINNDLTVFYQSPNKHCELYIALAHRLAKKYGDKLEITNKQCMLAGDDTCEMHIHFIELSTVSDE